MKSGTYFICFKYISYNHTKFSPLYNVGVSYHIDKLAPKFISVITNINHLYTFYKKKPWYFFRKVHNFKDTVARLLLKMVFTYIIYQFRYNMHKSFSFIGTMSGLFQKID